jgi:hypothetical protein
MYENRTMKTVVSVLRRDEEKMVEGALNLIKIHCKHVCKYHDKTLLRT